VIALTESPIDAEPLRRAVAAPGAGAVVVFHGAVRDATKGRRVLFLEYEAYPAMAIAELARIADEVRRAHGLLGIACVHRIGRLAIGEDAVVLATSAPHRRAALDAVEDFVVRLKRDVPIWKKEHFEDGAVWVGSPEDPQGAGPASRPPREGAR
jgi:molybdopterin synthase catalytic subunit